MAQSRHLMSVFAIALSAVLFGAACATHPPAAQGTTEVKTNRVTGSASATIGRSLESMHQIALDTMSHFKFTVSKNNADALTGIIAAKTADGKTVNIETRSKGENLSEVSVSAGPFNDDLAVVVMSEIQKRAK